MPNTYRRGRSVPFIQVPFDLIDDPNVDALGIAAYIVLKRFADIGSEGGSYVSDGRAAELIGVSTRTLIRRRQILRNSGWLEWEGRQGHTNKYLVHATHAQPVTDSHTTYDSESHPPMTQSHTTNIQSTKKQLPNGDVTEVFDHWNEKRKAIGLRAGKLTQKRKTKIEARLKDGWSVLMLQNATDACFQSEYHLENGYLDIELICRDDSKVEMFLARWKKHKKELPTEPTALYYRVCPICDQEHEYKLTRTEYDELASRDFTCVGCSQTEGVA